MSSQFSTASAIGNERRVNLNMAISGRSSGWEGDEWEEQQARDEELAILRQRRLEKERLREQAYNTQHLTSSLVAPSSGSSQFFVGAHDISMGPTTIHSAGRDIAVTNNYISRAASSNTGLDGVTFREVVKWLAAPSFSEILRTASDHRMEGTGEWFLQSEEFQHFVDTHNAIIWGTGPPGAGKTYLSGASTEKLEQTFEMEPEVAVIHAFLRYSEKYTPYDIYTAILHQFISTPDRRAFQRLENDFNRFKRRDPTLAKKLSQKQVIKMIQDVRPLFGKVFFVIDGLDEGSDELKNSLLQVLPSLGANLLIMSRPLDIFTPRLPSALHVPIQARTHDIDLFVRELVKRNAQLHTILHGDDVLIAELSARVNKTSRGMFLVAHLQMEAAIEKATSINTLFRELDELPSGINELYHRTMERIKNQSREHVFIAKRVFTWLLRAKHPLSTRDVQLALTFSMDTLTFDPGDLIPIPIIVSVCGGLVEVRKGQYLPSALSSQDSILFDELRFIHYTAQEYLLEFPPVHSIKSRMLMSTTCLATLREHLAYLQTDVYGHDEIYLAMQSQPLLWYAYSHWAEHVRELEKLEVDAGSSSRLTLEFLASCTSFPEYYQGFDPQSCSRGVYQPFRLTGLHLAARHGLVNVIRSGCLPFAADSDGFTPLHFAAMYNNVEAFRVLVETYPSAPYGATRIEGYSALHLAVLSRCEAIIRELLNPSPSATAFFKAGTNLDVNVQDNRGFTPLNVACAKQLTLPLDVLRLFLAHPDVDPNIPDHSGITPLMRSSRTWLLELVSHPHVDVNKRDADGHTTLSRVYHHCPPSDLYPILARPDLDVNARHPLGEHILLAASSMSWTPDMIESCTALLSRHDLDLNVQDRIFRQTALMRILASLRPGEVEGIRTRVLGDPGINVNVQDRNGRTALMHLILTEGGRPSSAIPNGPTSFLFHPNLDLTIQDRSGMNALMHAVVKGCVDAVISLTSHPAVDMNAQEGFYGRTALMLSICSRRTSCVAFLVSRADLDINKTDSIGRTALFYAAGVHPCLETTAMLLSLPRIKPDVQDKAGISPLMIAAFKKLLPIVKALLDSGASPLLQDNSGRDAMDLAGYSSNSDDLARDARDGRFLDTVRLLFSSAANAPHLLPYFSTAPHPPLCSCIACPGKDAPPSLIQATLSHDWNSLRQLILRPDVDINARDGRGATALIHASTFKPDRTGSPFDPVLRIASHPKTDVNAQDLDGNTALLHLCAHRHLTPGFLLLVYHPDIDPNVQDSTGSTALMKAVSLKNKVAAHLVSLPSCDLNIPRHDLRTPLMEACRYRDIGLVKQMLAKGANPHLRDANGWSALEWACGGPFNEGRDFEENVVSIIEVLLSYVEWNEPLSAFMDEMAEAKARALVGCPALIRALREYPTKGNPGDVLRILSYPSVDIDSCPLGYRELVDILLDHAGRGVHSVIDSYPVIPVSEALGRGNVILP